jgi:ubiquinone/menaquinone biosynthesis C-methylase UbiE
MQREVIDELLDDDLGTPREIAASLVDLRHINDWFGGTRTAIQLLRKVAQDSGVHKLSLLEVGSGAGDVPAAAQRALGKEGIALTITLLDRVATHLPSNGTAATVGDALRLPFRDNSFDIVGCSLLAHHFDPEMLVQFARESLRVSRRAVVINDLIRSRLHLVLTYLGLPLFRSRITWHDAPASVRRAYTRTEMRQILQNVCNCRIEVSTHYLYRMGIVLWK